MPTSLIRFSLNNPTVAHPKKVPAGADDKRRDHRSALDWYVRRKPIRKFRCDAFCFLTLRFHPAVRCPSLCHPQQRGLNLDRPARLVRDHGKTPQCTTRAAQKTRMPMAIIIPEKSRAAPEKPKSTVLPRGLGGA